MLAHMSSQTVYFPDSQSASGSAYESAFGSNLFQGVVRTVHTRKAASIDRW